MRKGVRNLTLLILVLLVAVGLVWSFVMPARPSAARCERIEVEVTTEGGDAPLFLTSDRIIDELARRGVRLKGRLLDSIDLRQIERTMMQLPIYSRAEAFVSRSTRTIQLRLREKLPLYVVIERSGRSYYVTQDKGTIRVNPSYPAYLPVVSGDVDEVYATGPVYEAMQAVLADPYFADYFGQMHVDKQEGLSLIPRIGTTRVILGHTPNWAEKLRKWRIFAESVLPRRGMNAFSYVNLDYDGQVVARERYLPEDASEEETAALAEGISPSRLASALANAGSAGTEPEGDKKKESPKAAEKKPTTPAKESARKPAESRRDKDRTEKKPKTDGRERKAKSKTSERADREKKTSDKRPTERKNAKDSHERGPKKTDKTAQPKKK